MTLDLTFESTLDGQRYIPLEEAKALIIDSLTEFDPILGEEARAILCNDARTNIIEEPVAKTNMMVCRPAGVTIDDLKAADMYIEDYADRFGPHFTEQDNPTAHAIIDFEYDGTPKSVFYLGHELGHAIADRLQNNAGFTHRDNPTDMPEKQAYYVQKIVTEALRDIPIYRQAAESEDDMHFSRYRDPDGIIESPISFGRAEDYVAAAVLYNRAKEMSPAERHEHTLSILGADGPLGAQEIFASIGIDNSQILTIPESAPAETADTGLLGSISGPDKRQG